MAMAVNRSKWHFIPADQQALALGCAAAANFSSTGLAFLKETRMRRALWIFSAPLVAGSLALAVSMADDQPDNQASPDYLLTFPSWAETARDKPVWRLEEVCHAARIRTRIHQAVRKKESHMKRIIRGGRLTRHVRGSGASTRNRAENYRLLRPAHRGSPFFAEPVITASAPLVELRS